MIKNITPSKAEIKNLLQQFQTGRFDIAIKLALSMTKKFPTYQFGWKVLGTLLAKKGKLDEAVIISQKAVDLSLKDSEAQNNLGVILKGLGRLDEAVTSFKKALALKANYVEAHNNLGLTLVELGRFNEALSNYKQVVLFKPNLAEAHNNLGNTLAELGRFDEAISSFKQALTLKADFAEVHNNLGNTLAELGRFDEAISSYKQAITLKANYAEAHSGLGVALIKLGRLDEAEISFKQAIAFKANYAEAHNNLAITLKNLGKFDEAIESSEIAISIKPDYEYARSINLNIREGICDWGSIEQFRYLIPSLGISKNEVDPFIFLSLEDEPDRNRLRSEIFSRRKFKKVSMPFKKNVTFPKRIRIGYFSADFHNHPIMHLAVQIFATHDRTKFEIFAFSYGPDKQDEMRKRLVNNVDNFHDVHKMDNIQIVKLARQAQLDIAVDLTGFTKNNRLDLFAYGLAPVQISYLGYPGTLGTSFIDYIIADPVIIPKDKRKYFSEKIIYLPNSYQPNDNTRAISQKAITRMESGLPSEKFVFCCFNQVYKISPKEFDIWMRLLSKVDGSVLWLLQSNFLAEKNLRREAEKRNISANRLIFAKKLPHTEHLSRLRLADLFLDTFNYNAHTTASDALWVGLPVVTKLGKGFASRVAGSLLHAIGVSELVTENEQNYESLALHLARNPDALLTIKKKIKANRLSHPLFDTERYTKDLETGYAKAYQNYYDGHPPKTIHVLE